MFSQRARHSGFALSCNNKSSENDDHRVVDIEGEPRHVGVGQGVEHEILIELDQRAQRLLGEPPEPVAHRAGGRHRRQAREAADERIAHQILEMLQPPGTDVQQGHEQQGEPRPAVVTADRRTGRVQAARDLELPQVPPQQLETAIRGELLGTHAIGKSRLTACRKLPTLKRIRGASVN